MSTPVTPHDRDLVSGWSRSADAVGTALCGTFAVAMAASAVEAALAPAWTAHTWPVPWLVTAALVLLWVPLRYLDKLAAGTEPYLPAARCVPLPVPQPGPGPDADPGPLWHAAR
ncbi:hypothetical protein QNO07_03845 [Streptomyces sp. 549]|uniref:hypothetical protein n=1 Tax=Streptomyces sp. 549 TaxID=3049076 RepID=UPI0024C23BEB|nr:hypothetical protein [Streptomyces sp. 549]MDK1472568.1 hypothetical protein [Streptomyces sp. 549]